MNLILIHLLCSKYFEPEARCGWYSCSCLKNEVCALFTRVPHALVMPPITGQAEGCEIFVRGSAETCDTLWPHQKLRAGRRVKPLRFACPCDESPAGITWLVSLTSRARNSSLHENQMGEGKLNAALCELQISRLRSTGYPCILT